MATQQGRAGLGIQERGMNVMGRAQPPASLRACGGPGGPSQASQVQAADKYSVWSRPTDIQPGTRLPQPRSSRAAPPYPASSLT